MTTTTTLMSKGSHRLAAAGAATAGTTTLGWMLWKNNQQQEEEETRRLQATTHRLPTTTKHDRNVTRLLPLPSSPSSSARPMSTTTTLTHPASSLLLALSPQQSNSNGNNNNNNSPQTPKPASWIQRKIIFPVTGRLPTPRLLTKQDPALKLPARCKRQRQQDELRLRQLMEKAQVLQKEKAPPQQQQQQRLGQQLFETAYGQGVTPQQREDFLIRYGCTGFTDEIVEYLVHNCGWNAGIVEIGAGHGQWARALNDKYNAAAAAAAAEQQQHVVLDESNGNSNTSRTTTPKQQRSKNNDKHFDFCLAYDDQSNLPLNTHIYNQYTQPHHDYFGKVHKLGGSGSDGSFNNNGNHAAQHVHLRKLLSSWTCRGRVLMIVYPPPGPMAVDVLNVYLEAAPDNINNTFVYVGEGRGGANGNDDLFDLLENGEWILLKEMDVKKPPGDKGYEKLFVLQRRRME